MSVAQKFETGVTGALNEKVVGFAWVALIPLLIPILTEFLSSCLNKQPKAAVMARLGDPNDFWVRVQTRRALDAALRETKMSMNFIDKTNAITAIIGEVGKTDAAALVDEVADNTSGWRLI